MNRRDVVKTLISLPAAGALLSMPTDAEPASVAIYDGRFEQARTWARASRLPLDCQHDAAGLWFARISGQPVLSHVIRGLTTQADFLVLADCAGREGLSHAQLRHPHGDGLVAWLISQRSQRRRFAPQRGASQWNAA